MTVVSLNDHRPQRNGTAKCTHCGYTWYASAPVDLANFECPRCRLKRGVWYGITVTNPEEQHHFTCVCGNTFFELRPSNILCIDCGEVYPWDQVHK